MSDFLYKTQFKARKFHRCQQCGGSIYPGTRYLKYVGSRQGDFSHWKRHVDCDAAWEWWVRKQRIYDYNDELPWLSDVELEDTEVVYVKENWPWVAVRLRLEL